MDKLKIKVSIAGRTYPLTINRDEEENIRKAATKVEAIIKQFESNYAVKDKQDLLAMCLIEYASKFETLNNKKEVEDDDLIEQLTQLENILTENIE